MPSAWITHVKKVYAAKKKKNPAYKYSQAMKDGKATYKRTAAKAPAKKTRKKKSKKAVEEEEEEVGGSLRRRVKKKKTMKILKM